MYGTFFLTNFSFTDISSIKSPSLSVTMATSYLVMPSVEEHLDAMLRSKIVWFVLEPAPFSVTRQRVVNTGTRITTEVSTIWETSILNRYTRDPFSFWLYSVNIPTRHCSPWRPDLSSGYFCMIPWLPPSYTTKELDERSN